MKLFCGSDLSEPTTDTLYQFEEGKRAHTIKFSPYQIENNTTINSLNTNKIIKFPKSNMQINLKENITDNNNLNKYNKYSSNDLSELEIIEYPINEINSNDYKNNFIKKEKDTNFINKKHPNNIINFLKSKPGFNHLNHLFENDDSSIESNSEDKYNIKDDSSKSDEIICSYVEIDNSNSVQNRKVKKNIIKNSSKIFSQIHKTTKSDYSFGVKSNDNSCNHKKAKKHIKMNSKTKTGKNENKINIFKKITKTKKNMIIKKLMVSKKIIQPKENFKVNYIKKHNSKKNFEIKNSQYPKRNLFESLKAFNSFRTIAHLRNSSPKNKSLIKEKPNINPRKSHKLNTQIIKHYFKINKTITENRINNKGKYDNKIIFNTIVREPNINSIKKVKGKNIIKGNTNTLFKSIEVKNGKNLKKNNFLTFKKDFLNSKSSTINTKNIDSKGKLRKLLLDKNYKTKFDISLNNINSINNNMNLLIKKEKNKTVNKLMNKSEANKELNNNTKKIKSQNKNNKNIKEFLKNNSISNNFKQK